jgi:hypothetical protein
MIFKIAQKEGSMRLRQKSWELSERFEKQK